MQKNKTYLADFSAAGKVVAVYDIRTLTPGTPVQDILLETTADRDETSNTIVVSFIGDNANKYGNSIKCGEHITVGGQVYGYYTDGRWCNTLAAQKIIRHKEG